MARAKRYLRAEKGAMTFDRTKMEEDARYDGRYVLKTNTDLPVSEVTAARKELWKIEQALRELKSSLGVRMVCFLAFYLRSIPAANLSDLCNESDRPST